MNETESYRLIKPGEEEETFAMIDRGFNAYVRDDFASEGVEEFYRAIRIMVFERPSNHFIVVAESDSQIVGMIDVKENYHISIFFVEPSCMGKGIGRGLLSHAIMLCQQKNPDFNELDVHSSPWAVPVYGKLGFKPTGPEQESHGIRYTRMIEHLKLMNG
ncbi:MAG: GNAT family N-acetyltransferase [Desulfobacteraceae bacterium]|jgi:GNAT superfamily N-acetyltransferase